MLELWYRALHSDFGIKVKCSDVNAVRQKLYSIRREVQDSALEDLALCVSPLDPQHLWIVKRRSKDAP